MVKAGQEVLLYGVHHGKDDANRQKLFEALKTRTKESKPLLLQVEDPSVHPGFENVIPKGSDFLINLVNDVKALKSENLEAQNCDPCTVSWLAVNLYGPAVHPRISHENRHLRDYTFGHLLTEIDGQIQRAQECVEKFREEKRYLFKHTVQLIGAARSDYMDLLRHIKDIRAAQSDSLAATALELFTKEVDNKENVPPQFKRPELLAKLQCNQYHSAQELCQCVTTQEEIQNNIPVSHYSFYKNPRNKIALPIFKITCTTFDIPATEQIISNPGKNAASITGDLHREGIRSLLLSEGYKIPYVDYMSIDDETFEKHKEELFSPEQFKHLT